MKALVKYLLGKLGYGLVKKSAETHTHATRIDDEAFQKLYQKCSPYTCMPEERMYAVYSAVNYILSKNVPGSIVECGVWRGGCSMMIASMLLQNEANDRQLFLYDTFEGMSVPTVADTDYLGRSADKMLREEIGDKYNSVWCMADLDDVTNNIKHTGFPLERISFIKGKVEETIPDNNPGEIALLILDTDWYESTLHELIHLYPLLTTNGVLFIDDYGHWRGCRKAIDEYFAVNSINMLLSRVDYAGRMGIKN